MATALKAPGRLVGMHFFNPVHRMPLVEVVRAPGSDDRAVATVFALAVRMGKVPVIVRDGPGFLVNRVLGPYLNEGGHLLGEGATIEAIDWAMTGFGMPMGPIRLVDEVGIDIVRHAGASLHAAFGERLAPAPALSAIASSGRLGKKGGVGFYTHPKDERKVVVDASAYAAAGVAPRPGAPGSDEIRDRLVLAMVNEAARTLADGIAGSASDVDLAMIMGTGFPPFRGGLLRYADDLGVRTVLDRIEGYEAKLGVRFSPAPLLRDLASGGQTFYAAFPGGDRR
jgi:3-hydroxyacyl-CoA dehydrogenase